MIKVIYTNILDASKQESLFETQEQLEAHQALHPQMYDNSYTEIIPSKDAVVDAQTTELNPPDSHLPVEEQSE